MSTILVPKNHIKSISILTKRNLLRFFRDKSDVRITFGQAPLLAIAFFAVFQAVITVTVPNLFQPLRLYLEGKPTIIIFLAVLTAIWFGSSKAITEIPKNRVLHQQEHLSFLNNFDYIISNFITLAVIVFGQIFLFSLAFHLLFITIPAELFPTETGLKDNNIISILMPGLFLKFTFLMWLTGLASIGVATFFSTFIPTVSAANAILPFIIIIQILLGGSIIKPVRDMNPFVEFFADGAVSRWGFEAAVLLFENELNLSLNQPMPYFTKELNSNVLGDIYSLNKESNVIPSIVRNNPNTIITIAWLTSLYQAMPTEASEKEKTKTLALNNLLNKSKDLNKSDEDLPKKINTLMGKVKFSSANSIFNIPISSDTLKEANDKFYGKEGATDGEYAKKIMSVLDKKLIVNTKDVNIILDDVLKIHPKLILFRFQHEQKTWLVLMNITFISLLLSWLSLFLAK